MKRFQMMRVTLTLAFAVMTLSSGLAYGIGADGSGGGIAVKVNGKIELLDLAEARSIRITDLPEFAALKSILIPMRSYNHTLAETILNAIEQKIYFYFTPFELVPTLDSNSLVQVNELQAAAQRGKVVVLNEGHWQKLDAQNRVGVLFHEVILNLNPKQDRMMLRRVVSRIMTQNFEDEAKFTHFLYAMGLFYPAGDTPRCKKSFAYIEKRVKQYVDTFEKWAHSDKADSDLCGNAADDFTSKLRLELAQALPPSYCAADPILSYYNSPLTTAKLRFATECLVMAMK